MRFDEGRREEKGIALFTDDTNHTVTSPWLHAT